MSSRDTFTLEPKTSNSIDWGLLFITFSLVTIGLLSLYSAAFNTGMTTNFYKQLMAVGIGTVGIIILFFMPKNLFKNLSYPIYVVTIILLVFVGFFGTEIAGTKGWLRIGGFSLQPAEFAKLSVIMLTGVLLSSRWANIKNIRTLMLISLITVLPIGLIMYQPDVGTATVIMAVYLVILFWAGFDVFVIYAIVSLPILIILSIIGNVYLIVGFIVLSILAFLFKRKIHFTIIVIAIFGIVSYLSPVLYEKLMPHQQKRIQSFLDPYSDPLGSGYNVIQSILAVGSGGATGKGFLQGTQTQLRYIPMQWTDFIYSVPTEEFGFVGGSIVIILYALLIWKAVKIATTADSKFYSILAIGIAGLFLYHCVVNIGMAIGLVPVMGIPLPFMSYGGSFMMMNLFLIGILLHIQRQQVISRNLYRK
jgi:rod shape determining protein RodA